MDCFFSFPSNVCVKAGASCACVAVFEKIPVQVPYYCTTISTVYVVNLLMSLSLLSTVLFTLASSLPTLSRERYDNSKSPLCRVLYIFYGGLLTTTVLYDCAAL